MSALFIYDTFTGVMSALTWQTNKVACVPNKDSEQSGLPAQSYQIHYCQYGGSLDP